MGKPSTDPDHAAAAPPPGRRRLVATRATGGVRRGGGAAVGHRRGGGGGGSGADAAVGTDAVRVGFVPLVDAAPLIAAQELGLFAQEGVRVSLERQLGWANVRDKLTYGHLDASHALVGMPVASALGADWFAEPLVSVMGLGSGGNAVTLSEKLVARGVRSAATLARWVKDPHHDTPPVLAHVFGCSMHHYLLREWLASAGVDPDVDVRLSVIPPPQMVRHMQGGLLDGFCVGEPWNTLAERGGCGTVVTPTADILPAHPEKVLAVTRAWAARNDERVCAMVRALLRACNWCDDPANQSSLADMLANARYVDAPRDVVLASLRLDRRMGLNPPFAASTRPIEWRMRSFAPAATFPNASHAAWVTEQMIRWGHAPVDTDVIAVAKAATDSSYYRRACATLAIECEPGEFMPMPMRHGSTYDPAKPVHAPHALAET